MFVESDCPCGSELKYSECCQKVHRDQKCALTAEQLMRSRFSAFSLGLVEYLRDSLAVEKQAELNLEELKQWVDCTEWQKLDVLRCSQGSEEDTRGVVEFRAEFCRDNQTYLHHEISVFKKENDLWYYSEGYFPAEYQLGRNEPCFCGSGRKYKKCCGE